MVNVNQDGLKESKWKMRRVASSADCSFDRELVKFNYSTRLLCAKIPIGSERALGKFEDQNLINIILLIESVDNLSRSPNLSTHKTTPVSTVSSLVV
jgi:hypothetical protein